MDLRDQLQSTLGDAYRLERELGGGHHNSGLTSLGIALGTPAYMAPGAH